MKVKIYNGPQGCYMSKEDEKKVWEMIGNYTDDMECERTKENDDVLGQVYALLIKSQDIDDVELRKDTVNIIWATLMVHLKNKNMDNNNNG